jgi:hypothetical protein
MPVLECKVAEASHILQNAKKAEKCQLASFGYVIPSCIDLTLGIVGAVLVYMVLHSMVVAHSGCGTLQCSVELYITAQLPETVLRRARKIC